MTAPQVDIDQLRRQFPEEVVRYFDAVVAAKFAEVDWRMQDIEDTLTQWETDIPQIAQSAADQAEADFVAQALDDIVEQITPEIDEYIAQWIVDENTWTRFKFYIDTQENIEALSDREDNIIYIWKEAVS